MSTTATPITTTIISSSTPTGRWKTTRSGSRTTSRWSRSASTSAHQARRSSSPASTCAATARTSPAAITSCRGRPCSSRRWRSRPMPATSASTTPRSASIIDEAYAAAGMKPGDIDTGVVILTGEALRRENAEAIAALLAEQRGDFVTATAGHHMESMLAAYGSGASKVSYDAGQAHPQPRYRRRHHQARHRRQGRRDRDRRAAYRRPAAGGRRHRPHRAAGSGGQIPRPRGRLLLVARRRALAGAARQGGGEHGRPAGRGAHQAAGAARGRASLPDRPDRRARPHRRRDVFRRRRGICLRPRGARLRRHGAPSRPGDPPARRFRRAAVAAAAGRRVHPRHRARRLRIQRAAQRQYQLHLETGRASPAPQSAGAAAVLCVRGGDRPRTSSPRRSARISPPSI